MDNTLVFVYEKEVGFFSMQPNEQPQVPSFNLPAVWEALRKEGVSEMANDLLLKSWNIQEVWKYLMSGKPMPTESERVLLDEASERELTQEAMLKDHRERARMSAHQIRLLK